jgi:1,4-alpha-glucan branching enzyme
MKTTRTLPYSLLSEFDIALFKSGKHYHLHRKMGAHLLSVEEKEGCYFSVWAPHAKFVSVIGSFNHWNPQQHPLYPRWDSSGIWEGFIPSVKRGDLYKYHVVNRHNDIQQDKADPFAFHSQKAPNNASIVWRDSREFTWKDQTWTELRTQKQNPESPISVYEVHLGSWRKKEKVGENWYSYEELIDVLVPYVKKMHFTHVELLPIMEHPYFPSWGYQVTGYYAPTARYGTPEGLKKLIDAFHAEEIGVILDWVPSHFPSDGHGLNFFDGNHLYEHPDPRKGYHNDWQSMIFDYGRPEVKSFLISSALFWLEEYHADGLRVDAVASMIYLDYSRKEGEWIPNRYGGREYLEALDFIKECNEAIKTFYPGALIIAEESTAFPKVTGSTREGALGFDQKWMMGWMHDTLEYFQSDPLFRKFKHHKITFSTVYAFSEKFMLPLSHDEVVHGKKSLLDKMPGSMEQKFANLRLLYVYMFTHPGTKLLFMGGEFGQWIEWAFTQELDWHLLNFPLHQGIQNLVIRLNQLYKEESSLYENQFQPQGFEWLVVDDGNHSVLIYKRMAKNPQQQLIMALNLTPVVRENYPLALEASISGLKIVLDSLDPNFGGEASSENTAFGMQKVPKQSVWNLRLPPLSAVILRPIFSKSKS